MDLTGIKNIVFDFGGVLVNLNKEHCKEALTRLGVRNIDHYITNYGHTGIFGQLENGDVDEFEFYEGVRQLILRQRQQEARRLQKAALSAHTDAPVQKTAATQTQTAAPLPPVSETNAVPDSDTLSTNPETAPLPPDLKASPLSAPLPTDEELEEAWSYFLEDIPVKKIKMVYALSRRYRVFLLSNTSAIHLRALRQFDQAGFPVEECFEKCYCSYQMHCSKPYPLIFEKMLDDAQIKPGETLFVDDGPGNCGTAAALGMRVFKAISSEDFCDKLFPDVMAEVNAGRYDNRPFQACVATMGFFDGVHRGHRCLMEQLREAARQRRMPSMVLSFWPHPRKVVQTGYCPRLLTDCTEKQVLLRSCGVDKAELIDFTPQVASMSAREFMEEVLLKRYNVRCLLVGYDHGFGKGRCDSFQDYKRYGHELGIEVIQARPFSEISAPGSSGSSRSPESSEGPAAPGSPEGPAAPVSPEVVSTPCSTGAFREISSSYIRQCLESHRVADANAMLGYDFALAGTVVRGFGNGSRLGFPTANLALASPDKLIPANGVYAVEVDALGKTFQGMLNIGCRPTLHNGDNRSIEVNLFGFEGDLYGQTVAVRLKHFVREEKAFDSLEELKAQLLADREAIQRLASAGSD